MRCLPQTNQNNVADKEHIGLARLARLHVSPQFRAISRTRDTLLTDR
jgi:hypothetical protein